MAQEGRKERVPYHSVMSRMVGGSNFLHMRLNDRQRILNCGPRRERTFQNATFRSSVSKEVFPSWSVQTASKMRKVGPKQSSKPQVHVHVQSDTKWTGHRILNILIL